MSLNFDANDENYKLLSEIFKIIASRDSKRIMPGNALKNINPFVLMPKNVYLFEM